jgi:hypothetical protein
MLNIGAAIVIYIQTKFLNYTHYFTFERSFLESPFQLGEFLFEFPLDVFDGLLLLPPLDLFHVVLGAFFITFDFAIILIFLFW